MGEAANKTSNESSDKAGGGAPGGGVFSDPFDFLDDERLKSWLVNAASVAAALLVALTLLDLPLRHEGATWGIVSLELAGGAEQAQAIIGVWDLRLKVLAAFAVGLDFLFLAAYSATFAFLLVWLNRRLKWRAPNLLARLMVLAAALDAAENLALFQMIRGLISTGWAYMATGCAVVKFALVAAAIGYAVVMVYRHVFGKAAQS